MKKLAELKSRATSKTPKFWRNVQIAGAVIGTIGILITTAPVSIPAGLAAWGSYLITIGASLQIGQFAKE